jgi:antitoxin component YwqK of YwqJK toxin-antitoxin module
VVIEKMVEKKPVNLETTLILRDGVWFTIDTNEPYSGKVFSLHENGEKWEEGVLKDGTIEGKWIDYYDNGQKKAD